MLKNIHLCLPHYLKDRLFKLLITHHTPRVEPMLFTICDHYEPHWKKVNYCIAAKRVKTRVDVCT